MIRYFRKWFFGSVRFRPAEQIKQTLLLTTKANNYEKDFCRCCIIYCSIIGS